MCSLQAEFVAWWRSNVDVAGGTDLQKKLAQIAKVGKQRHHVDVHIAAWSGSNTYVQRFLELDPELVSALDDSEFGVRMCASTCLACR